ncbi:hypothetical protein M413DRAFT_450126 [Hebeloma cylindrosporum]|uniref:Uncharacterized protein n=1 Tax=Hebeloma cylindrosporum TaxID=76867 RepID=A0A0C2X9H6_HEBCY|nr:hypothetical protein M413DRAFT_450126 [Hebeloma cylindrosporum h7]
MLPGTQVQPEVRIAHIAARGMWAPSGIGNIETQGQTLKPGSSMPGNFITIATQYPHQKCTTTSSFLSFPLSSQS